MDVEKAIYRAVVLAALAGAARLAIRSWPEMRRYVEISTK